MNATNRPVALVTGARQGLGLASAVGLASAGFDIVLADLQRDMTDAVAAVETAGGSAKTLECDISKVDELPDAVAEAWAAFGGIDCLVNNAGLAMRPLTDILDITPDAYDRVVGVNQRGTFFLTQEVAKRMVEIDSVHHRSIVTISSIAARMVNTDRSPYHLSKAALSMLNELFAVRLAEHGIAAYEVRPGYMRTAMTASAVPDQLDARIREGRVPARRWGTPEDVGETVAALAAGRLPFSTGQAVWVDGGLHLNRAD